MSVVEADEVGVLDKVSAIVRSFPWRWEIVNLYFIKRMQNRCSLGDNYSLPKGTKGLWSVFNRNCIPTKYFLNCSQAQVISNSSFSICTHLFSVAVNAQEA